MLKNADQSIGFSFEDLQFYRLNEEMCTNEKLKSKNSCAEKNSGWIKNIETVKLHITNTCNLCCKYCYANQGNYHQKEEIMSPSKAEEIGYYIKKNMPKLENLLFFGGEPLLNPNVIEIICDILGTQVQYLLQTNGTIFDENILRIVKKYKIMTTVSIDYNKEIHDRNRIYKNQQGSYDIVKKNIYRFGENVVGLQGTVQNIDLKDKSIRDIVAEMCEMYHVPNVLVSLDINEDNKDMETMNCKEIPVEVDDFFAEVLKGKTPSITAIREILNCVFSQEENFHLCDAGYTLCTIDVNGNFYPCPMYLKPEYKIGNICDSILKLEQSAKKVQSVLSDKNNDDCQNCQAKFWCSYCTALLKENESVPKDVCQYYKILTKAVLWKLMEMIETNEVETFMEKYDMVQWR